MPTHRFPSIAPARLANLAVLAMLVGVAGCIPPGELPPLPGAVVMPAPTVVGGTVTAPPRYQVLEVYLADASGAPLPGVPTVQPDPAGQFRLPDVPVGRTFQVVAKVLGEDGKPAELASLVRTSELGTWAEITVASTLVTAFVTESAGNELGDFKATSFKAAAMRVAQAVDKEPVKDLGDRLGLLKRAKAVVAADPELFNVAAELRGSLGAPPLTGLLGSPAASPTPSADGDDEDAPSPTPSGVDCADLAVGAGHVLAEEKHGAYKGLKIPKTWADLASEAKVTSKIKGLRGDAKSCFQLAYPDAYAAYRTLSKGTPKPSPSPTDEPTDGPTDEPTDEPTDTPTDEPTATPDSPSPTPESPPPSDTTVIHTPARIVSIQASGGNGTPGGVSVGLSGPLAPGQVINFSFSHGMVTKTSDTAGTVFVPSFGYPRCGSVNVTFTATTTGSSMSKTIGIYVPGRTEGSIFNRTTCD